MNYNYLKEKIFGVLNFSYDGEIESECILTV